MNTIEVLVRTHLRPKCFSRCVASIREVAKTMPNTKVLIHGIFDNPSDYETYGKNQVDKHTPIVPNRQLAYPPNDYYRFAQKNQNCWILHLDDDDLMCGNWAIIEKNLSFTHSMILWRVWLAHKGLAVPEKINLLPMRKHTRGIGFLIHVSHWIPWPPIRAADVVVMQQLYRHTPHIWINQILTKTQGARGKCGRSGDY